MKEVQLEKSAVGTSRESHLVAAPHITGLDILATSLTAIDPQIKIAPSGDPVRDHFAVLRTVYPCQFEIINWRFMIDSPRNRNENTGERLTSSGHFASNEATPYQASDVQAVSIKIFLPAYVEGSLDPKVVRGREELKSAIGAGDRKTAERLKDKLAMHVVADSPNGPVDAFKRAFLRAFNDAGLHPDLKKLNVKFYELHNLTPEEGTASEVSVRIRADYKGHAWNMSARSEDSIAAAVRCLRDAYEYAILLDLSGESVPVSSHPFNGRNAC